MFIIFSPFILLQKSQSKFVWLLLFEIETVIIMNRIKTVRSGSINNENSQTMNSWSYPPKDLVLASVSLMFYFECLLFLLAFSGERPFVCNRPNCCKSFVSKSKLVEHLQRHNGEKRHMCCLCGKKYANKHDLRAHTRYVSSSSLFSSGSLIQVNEAVAVWSVIQKNFHCHLFVYLLCKSSQIQSIVYKICSIVP